SRRRDPTAPSSSTGRAVPSALTDAPSAMGCGISPTYDEPDQPVRMVVRRTPAVKPEQTGSGAAQPKGEVQRMGDRRLHHRAGGGRVAGGAVHPVAHRLDERQEEAAGGVRVVRMVLQAADRELEEQRQLGSEQLTEHLLGDGGGYAARGPLAELLHGV